MWQVVYMVKTSAEAEMIRQALEDEYMTPRIVEVGRSYQILVAESEVDDASEIIRDVIAKNG